MLASDPFALKQLLCVLEMCICWCAVTDKSCTQQRKQAFEEHDDGCVDEENDVGFYPSSKKAFEKESDSHFSYSSPLPPKRSALLYMGFRLFFKMSRKKQKEKGFFA